MTDKDFLKLIKENKQLGYGRMIQIISYAWYTKLLREHSKDVALGALTGTCIAFLNQEEKENYFKTLAADSQDNDMDY